jgi:hypothetical protein
MVVGFGKGIVIDKGTDEGETKNVLYNVTAYSVGEK